MCNLVLVTDVCCQSPQYQQFSIAWFLSRVVAVLAAPIPVLVFPYFVLRGDTLSFFVGDSLSFFVGESLSFFVGTPFRFSCGTPFRSSGGVSFVLRGGLSLSFFVGVFLFFVESLLFFVGERFCSLGSPFCSLRGSAFVLCASEDSKLGAALSLFCPLSVLCDVTDTTVPAGRCFEFESKTAVPLGVLSLSRRLLSL